MLVDSHVNLHHEKFAGEVDAIIENARNAGVGAMLTISDKISSTEAIKSIVARRRNIWRSVGAHPHYASDHLGLTAATLSALAADDATSSASASAVSISTTGFRRATIK